MKILVVDDEPDAVALFQQQFRMELRRGEVILIFAESAEAALERLAAERHMDVVLILSDINMPGMNGLELLRRLKACDPRRPVAMVTAYDNEENRRLAARLGADAYLTKPLNFSHLREVIARLEAATAGAGG